ncbi:MAG TPA: hypothetical protein VMB49_14420 [Acidobacteriaceae bacterium]|nr:hypothetical protein [Acidobacteriaceae bacterium]
MAEAAGAGVEAGAVAGAGEAGAAEVEVVPVAGAVANHAFTPW